jgi:hypothetical protein
MYLSLKIFLGKKPLRTYPMKVYKLQILMGFGFDEASTIVFNFAVVSG